MAASYVMAGSQWVGHLAPSSAAGPYDRLDPAAKYALRMAHKGTLVKLATVGVSAILEVVQRNPAGRETSLKGTPDV